MSAVIVRTAVALLPLACAPLLVYLIGDGHISFGGGEKDLVWVLPWFLWSLLFGLTSLGLWYRGWPALRSTVWSVGAGFVGVIVAAAILAMFAQLGVAGRF